MADYNLGTAKGRIRTEYDSSGATAAKKSLESVDKSTQSLNKGFEKIRNVSGGASIAIAAGLAFAANKAIDFQKQISAIGAVSGATGEQLTALRKKALQLGADTTFSASEAANAMEELAKAGVGVDDILNGAADAATALAAAGGVDLPTAAEIAANALGQFQLKAKDLAHVVDLIAGAANASAISVDDFNLSMKQAGAVANLVGVNFDDMAVAIALLGRNGIKGSDAGTSLKTMLLNLQPATHKQAEEFKRLGIITKDGSNIFFDANGNLKSLADISGILADKTKNMTAAQRSATLELLFGSDAIRAAAILTKNGAEGFESMAAAMGKIKAADVAKARLDNVAGSIEQLKGSLETGAITIGSALLPAIKKVTDFLTQLTNKFNSLDPRWQKLIAFAAVGAAALLALVSAIAAIGFAITGVSTVLAVLSGGGIIAGIIAGIGLIVAAFVLLWKRSEAFRTAVGTIFSTITQHVAAMRKVLQPFVDFIRNTLIPILANGFKKAIDNLQPAFEAISTFVREKVSPALVQLEAALTKAMPTIIAITKFFGQNFVTALQVAATVLGFFIRMFLDVAGVVIPIVVKAISFMIEHIDFFIGAIKGIGIAAAFVFNFLQGAVQAVVAFWVGAWNLAGNIVKGVWNAIVNYVKNGIAAVQGYVAKVAAVRQMIFDAFERARAAVVEKTAAMVDFVKGLPGKILSALGNLGSLLYNKGKEIIQGLINGIGDMIGKLKSKVSEAVSAIGRFLPGSPAKEGPLSGRGYVKIRGQHLVEDFATGINDNARMVEQAIAALIGGVGAGLPNPNNAAAVAGAVATGGTGTATLTRPAAPASADNSVSIDKIEIKGIWDMTDPLATRKIVKDLDRELTDFQKGYKR
jgi:TP901 family phage tail tape measure protein